MHAGPCALGESGSLCSRCQTSTACAVTELASLVLVWLAGLAVGTVVVSTGTALVRGGSSEASSTCPTVADSPLLSTVRTPNFAGFFTGIVLKVLLFLLCSTLAVVNICFGHLLSFSCCMRRLILIDLLVFVNFLLLPKALLY
jgi:hypothetical protein